MAKILVACEESQAVTIELRKMGIEAYSCDIIECSGGHPEWHLQQDVTPLLEQEWDMIIAFPPCTHLAVSGARHFAVKRADGRQQAGVDFFLKFTNVKCERVAIENPVGIMSSLYRKPNQIIHPYMFGEPVSKKTCLWLKGLPELTPVNAVQPLPAHEYPDGYKLDQWMKMCGDLPHSERVKTRSKTFAGIAKAMANQWGGLLI